MAKRNPKNRTQNPGEEEDLDPTEETPEDEPEDEDESEDEDREDDGEDDEDDTEQLLADEDAAAEQEPLPFYLDLSGYSDTFDWGSLPEPERTVHEEILKMDLEQLEKLKLSRLGLLDRWGAALAYLRHGRHDVFQDSCRSILRSRSHHDGLSYEDIHLELIASLAQQNEREEAFATLEKFTKTFPNHADAARRVRALLLLMTGPADEGRVALQEVVVLADRHDHADICLNLGDQLMALGLIDQAADVFKRGRAIARRLRDPELISALDVLQRDVDERLEQRQRQPS
jgi:tetratricopeptide (TPR) repeat protein